MSPGNPVLPSASELHVDDPPDFTKVKRVVIAVSGGKDSIACIWAVKHELARQGASCEIELMHHDVDGEEVGLFDWPCTRGYVRRLAGDLKLPIYFSWKVGGLEGEMLRKDAPTAPTRWERPDGFIAEAGGKGPLGTRQMFPQVAADLRVRYCTAYVKVDVGTKPLSNDDRFFDGTTVFVTGERAEESANRSRYLTWEKHRTWSSKRDTWHWRPIKSWPEAHVWAAVRELGVYPHPAYWAGWGRVSCATCIFGSPDQWASLRLLAPEKFEAVLAYERQFGKTINRKLNVEQQADKGTPYAALRKDESELRFHKKWCLEPWPAHARTLVYPWHLPDGAFGESAGPT